MNNKQSIWTKDFILICLVSLATNITMRMLDANLASYASVTWNSKTLGGQLTSFFNIGSIAMAFISGRLVDLKGRRNSLIVFCLVFAIPTLGMALIPVPGVALGVRLIQGIAKGVVSVAMASVVSDITPRDRMNEGMGLFNLGNTISFAIGPMIGLALVDMGGYKLMFIICAIVYAMGSALTFPIRYENNKTEDASVNKEKTTSSSEYKGVWALIEKKAILPSLINTIFFGGYACILVFLTIYAQEILQLSSSKISLFYTVAAVAMLVVRLTTAKIADRYGALAMVIPGHVIMIGALLLLTYPSKISYIAFLAAGVCYGIGMAVVSPTLNAVAVVDSPFERSATANATFYFMMDFGILIASSSFGALMDKAATPEIGYTQTYLISCVVIVISMILCFLTMNDKARAIRRNK